MNLIKPNGQPFTGVASTDERGRAYHTVKIECNRCHVVNGERIWLMGIENGRPYSHTGFQCWTCGNTGVRGERREWLYTPAQYASLEKRRATVERKRQEREAAAEAARNAVFDQWLEANRHVVSQIVAFPEIGDKDNVIANSIKGRVIPQAWRLDSSIARILRFLAEQDIKQGSQYVGAVGETVELTLTVERVINLSYGRFPTIYRYLWLCRDERGNRIKYLGTASAMPDAGETAEIRAKVKAHEEYKGEQQTVIERPRAAKIAA